jgi:hypothetical protein
MCSISSSCSRDATSLGRYGQGMVLHSAGYILGTLSAVATFVSQRKNMALRNERQVHERERACQR